MVEKLKICSPGLLGDNDDGSDDDHDDDDDDDDSDDDADDDEWSNGQKVQSLTHHVLGSVHQCS